MIIDRDLLYRFGACEPNLLRFEEEYPEGLNVKAIWGTKEEASSFWRRILTDPFFKIHVGWAIHVGILPARIRADLRGADLRGANLIGANLTGADLSGANLSGARLWEANLRDISFNEYTIWPPGFDPKEETK